MEVKEPGRRVCLEGANGTGKTSILEAVYLLSRCKSFRTPRIGECAGWGRRSFGVAGVIGSGTRLKFEWSPAGRQLSVDGKSGTTLVEFWGRLPAIAITNSDRELVRGSGSNRRNWIDSLAASRQHDYLTLAQKAALLQRQKNAILKQERTDRTLWKILTDQMRSVCAEMNRRRHNIAGEVGPRIEEHYRQLTGSGEHIGFAGNRETGRRLDKSDDELLALEERSRNCELGPHREDWELSLEGKSLRYFGSEGQQKSAALAMRLAEISLSPSGGVVLIDDALIELDAGRRERFWSQLPGETQIFYASTDAGKDREFARFDSYMTITPGKVGACGGCGIR